MATITVFRYDNQEYSVGATMSSRGDRIVIMGARDDTLGVFAAAILESIRAA
jgi:hypothetical protein